MLTYESAQQVAAEPQALRFWHLAILIALRDKAERLELRFDDSGGGLLYHRVQGRDWEVAPAAVEFFAELKPAIRSVARLVAPERPDGIITYGIPDARLEVQEIGWLSYQLLGHVIDLAVRIDPREPYGYVCLEIEHAEEQEVAGLAASALADYYAADDEDDA